MPDEVRDGAARAGDPVLGFAVVGVLVAVVFATCVLRTVPPHQRLVVSGRRVLGPGLVAVWPPAARCVRVPVLPRELGVEGIPAVTADGIGVTATATAPCRVADPGLFAAGPGSAWATVDIAVEAAVRRHVAAHDLAALATTPEVALPAAAAAEQAARRGIELGPVEVRGLTVAVDGRLTRWATSAGDRDRAPTDDERA